MVFISLIVALLALAAPASPTATVSGPVIESSPDPSRIVLTPAADPSTEQLITWRTDAATETGSVEYESLPWGEPTLVEATSGPAVTFDGWKYQSRHHTARLTDLSPGTTYRYRVGGNGQWSRFYRFETASDTEKPWTLIYFGDAQTNLAGAWPPAVTEGLKRAPDAKMALHAGDLINESSKDSEWAYWFHALDGFSQTVNQMPVLGNHEHYDDPEISQFREHFAVPGNGPADFESTAYYTDYQGVRLIALDGNTTEFDEQVTFLEDALKDNPNEWTVVTFHQPIFPGRGDRDNPKIREAFLPVLEKYDVDLVLQGHDHVYARGYHADDVDPGSGKPDGPVYVVSVAGSKYYDLDQSKNNDWTKNGAVRVVAHDKTSTVQTISFDKRRLVYRSFVTHKGTASTTDRKLGEQLDAFTIKKRPNGDKVVVEGAPKLRKSG